VFIHDINQALAALKHELSRMHTDIV